MEASVCPVPVRPLQDLLPLLRRESFLSSLSLSFRGGAGHGAASLAATRSPPGPAHRELSCICVCPHFSDGEVEALGGAGGFLPTLPGTPLLCGPCSHPHPTLGQLDGASSDEDSTSSDRATQPHLCPRAPPAPRGRCQLPEVALGPWL